MRVYEAIAEELELRGVRVAFGLMGEETAKLIVEVDKRGIAYVATRHEAVAVGMADGYARISGRVGVAIISRGPGLTNALTAAVCAAKARTPVLILTGTSAIGIEDPNAAKVAATNVKHVDQDAILTGAGISHASLRSPSAVRNELRALFDRAASGMTIAVNVPTDVMEAITVGAATRPVAPSEAPSHEPEPPEPLQIDQAAELLEATWAVRRPVVLAGRGSVRARAKRELLKLSEMCGALLGTTLLAKSFFRGEQYDIGVVGSMSSTLALDFLQTTDLLLVFGSSLDSLTTFDGALFPRARLVQFDTDPRAFGRLPADLNVLGDARLSARALAQELGRRHHHVQGYRSPEVRDRIANFRVGASVENRGHPGGLDPRLVMIEIEELLPQDRTLVIDAAHHMSFSCAYLSVPDPDSFLIPMEGGGIGAGVGVALGAAFARRDRPTVLAVGDGGLMTALADLETAVRYRLPLIVLVLNDSAFGAEVHYLQTSGMPDQMARHANPPFEAVARGLGLDAATVSTLDDCSVLAGRFNDLTRPILIDCRVTSDVRGSWVDFHHRRRN